MKEAIRESKAQKIYVLNIMTKNGETNNYSRTDFVQKIEDCLETDVDAVVCNDSVPPGEILRKYRDHFSDVVKMGHYNRGLPNHILYSADMLRIEDGKIRHDPEKLANSVMIVMKRVGASTRNALKQHGKTTTRRFFDSPSPTH